MILAPCPFCNAGETLSQPDSKYWTGAQFTVLSWHVRHWCDYAEFAPLLTFRGKTQEQAEGRWNTRASRPDADGGSTVDREGEQ